MNLLELVSTAVSTAQSNDAAQEEVVRQAQIVAAAEARKMALQQKEDREWKAFVDGFRSIPEDMSTREFTEAAERLYTSPRFNAEAQEVFQTAVAADPSKFFALTVRDYLRRHNDEVIAKLYMTQFTSIPATTAELDKGHAVVWAAKAALSVAAATVDRAEGDEKKSARSVLKQFCTLVLDRFPHLPVEFYNLLTHVESVGDLRDPLQSQRQQVAYPTAREGAKEKQDSYPRNGHQSVKNGGAFKKPAPETKEATPDEVRAYMNGGNRTSAKPVATAPLGEQLKMKGITLIPGSRQHAAQTFENASELAQVF